MTGNSFVDTNVLLYAHDLQGREKNHLASKLIKNLWEKRCGVVSSQVLAEFSSVLIRKYHCPIPEILSKLEPYMEGWFVVPQNSLLLKKALSLQEKYHFAFWDSLVVQAALESNCHTLYSEDMSHQQKIASLTIINPFI